MTSILLSLATLAWLLPTVSPGSGPQTQTLTPISSNAMAITGNVRLLEGPGAIVRTIVFQNGRQFAVTGGNGGTYHITTPANPVLLHGNTLCKPGTNATTIYLQFGIGGAVSMSVYSGAGRTADCGDFSYSSR